MTGHILRSFRRYHKNLERERAQFKMLQRNLFFFCNSGATIVGVAWPVQFNIEWKIRNEPKKGRGASAVLGCVTDAWAQNVTSQNYIKLCIETCSLTGPGKWLIAVNVFIPVFFFQSSISYNYVGLLCSELRVPFQRMYSSCFDPSSSWTSERTLYLKQTSSSWVKPSI